MDYFKLFKITGVINSTVHDTGLTSSEEAHKRLKSILVNVEAREGNKVQGWLEREKVFDLYDHHLDTQELTGADTFPLSQNCLNEIPVGVDMPVGTTFKAAIECGATAKDLYGAYRYEIVS